MPFVAQKPSHLLPPTPLLLSLSIQNPKPDPPLPSTISYSRLLYCTLNPTLLSPPHFPTIAFYTLPCTQPNPTLHSDLLYSGLHRSTIPPCWRLLFPPLLSSTTIPNLPIALPCFAFPAPPCSLSYSIPASSSPPSPPSTYCSATLSSCGRGPLHSLSTPRRKLHSESSQPPPTPEEGAFIHFLCMPLCTFYTYISSGGGRDGAKGRVLRMLQSI